MIYRIYLIFFLFVSPVFLHSQECIKGVWYKTDGSFETAIALEEKSVLFENKVWLVNNRNIRSDSSEILVLRFIKMEIKISLQLENDFLIVEHEGQKIRYSPTLVLGNQVSHAHKIFPNRFDKEKVKVTGVVPLDFPHRGSMLVLGRVTIEIEDFLEPFGKKYLSVPIDSNGQFKVEFEMSHPCRVGFLIADKFTSFLMVPKGDYTIGYDRRIDNFALGGEFSVFNLQYDKIKQFISTYNSDFTHFGGDPYFTSQKSGLPYNDSILSKAFESIKFHFNAENSGQNLVEYVCTDLNNIHRCTKVLNWYGDFGPLSKEKTLASISESVEEDLMSPFFYTYLENAAIHFPVSNNLLDSKFFELLLDHSTFYFPKRLDYLIDTVKSATKFDNHYKILNSFLPDLPNVFLFNCAFYYHRMYYRFNCIDGMAKVVKNQYAKTALSASLNVYYPLFVLSGKDSLALNRLLSIGDKYHYVSETFRKNMLEKTKADKNTIKNINENIHENDLILNSLEQADFFTSHKGKVVVVFETGRSSNPYEIVYQRTLYEEIKSKFSKNDNLKLILLVNDDLTNPHVDRIARIFSLFKVDSTFENLIVGNNLKLADKYTLRNSQFGSLVQIYDKESNFINYPKKEDENFSEALIEAIKNALSQQ